jgi:hypothetical protein
MIESCDRPNTIESCGSPVFDRTRLLHLIDRVPMVLLCKDRLVVRNGALFGGTETAPKKEKLRLLLLLLLLLL